MGYKTVNIFGEEYAIIIKEMEPTHYGWIDYQQHVIYINKDIKGRQQIMMETILHEIYHGLLNRIHANAQISPELVEVIVDCIAKTTLDNFHVKFKNKKRK